MIVFQKKGKCTSLHTYASCKVSALSDHFAPLKIRYLSDVIFLDEINLNFLFSQHRNNWLSHWNIKKVIKSHLVKKFQCFSKFQACGCCGCCQIPSVTLYLVERQVALYVEEPDKIADLVSKARYKKFYKKIIQKKLYFLQNM